MFGLLVVVLVVLPLLLNLDGVRVQLQQTLSRSANGQISWDSLRIRLLPLPHAVVQGVRIDIPGKVAVSVEKAEAFLRVLPLLLGHPQVTSVRLVHPVVVIELIGSESAPPKHDNAIDPLGRYRAAMAPVVEKLRTFAPDSVIEIEAASVDVRAAGALPLELRNLSIRAQTHVDAAEFELSTASNLWKQLQLTGRVVFADLSARAEIDLVGLNPQRWLDRALASSGVVVAVGEAAVHAQLHTDAKASIECGLSLSTPALRITRQQRELQIAGLDAKLNAVATEQGSRVELTALRVGDLLPSGAAMLKIDARAQRPELSIDVAKIDLPAVRDAVLALMGDDPIIAAYAPRVRAGELTGVRVSANAERWSELFQVQRLNATAELHGGVASLPKVEREASGLAAKVQFAGGKVELSDVQGAFVSSRLANGHATYALDDRSAALEADIDVVAAEALEIARKMLPERDKTALQELTSATGHVRARISFDLANREWRASALIDRSDASAQLRRLPWPVLLRSAQVRATRDRLGVQGLTAEIGRSHIADGAADIGLGSGLAMRNASGRATLALDQLFPWLKSQEALAQPLREVNAVSGSAEVTLHRLAGDLRRPAGMDYDVTVHPQRVSVAHARLPAPVSVASGSVRIDARAIKFERVALGLLDGEAVVSGAIDDYRGKRLSVKAAIENGLLGPQAMQWAWRTSGAPARLELKTPLRFSAASLALSPGQRLDGTAALRFDGGQALAAQFSWTPTTLDVRSLTLDDQQSRARFQLRASDRLLRMAFSGALHSSSLAAMLKRGNAHAGVVSGDVRVTYDRDRRGRGTAMGKLAMKNIDLSVLLGKPIRVEQLDVTADGSVLRIRDSTVSWAEQVANISGEVKRGPRGAIIHARVESPGIVVDEMLPPPAPPDDSLEPAEPAESAAERGKLFPKLWPLPVTGEIELHADFVQYKQYRVMPVAAKLALEDERAQLDLLEGNLCGISIPLSLEVTPERVAASAHFVARRLQLEDTGRCLSAEHLLITGEFDLDANLTTSGRRSDFVRNLQGSVLVDARAGKVRKFALLGNILALKSITGLFKRGPPQLSGDGFAYSKLAVRGHLDAGKFVIEESAFDSDALGLAAAGSVDLLEPKSALTVLVAPFGTLDRLMRKVPIVGYVLGGTFTSVPVGVSGDIRQPIVVPLGPRAVTTQLLGIFERTLKLPGKLLAPLAGTSETVEPSEPSPASANP